MKPALALFVSALILAPILRSQNAAEPYSFVGFQAGASQHEIEQVAIRAGFGKYNNPPLGPSGMPPPKARSIPVAELSCRSPAPGIQDCLAIKLTQAAAAYPASACLTASFSFVDGRLARATCELSHSGYSDYVDTLQAKYGKPTKSQARTLQNEFGATFQATDFTWTNEVSEIETFEFVNDRNTSAVSVSHLALRLDYEKRAPKKPLPPI